LILGVGAYALFGSDSNGDEPGNGAGHRRAEGRSGNWIEDEDDPEGDNGVDGGANGNASSGNNDNYEPGPRLPGLPLTLISTRDVTDTGYLSLINHSHPAPSEPDAHLLESAWPTVAVSRIDGMYLHSSALRAISYMFATARAAEVGAFFVSSGFRDFYQQAYLYGDGTSGDLVMPPGFSEHHTGLAADILVVGLGMWDLVTAPEGLWLAANSYRYGLILRYPQGAEDITGIAFEPWHFRYVGRVHAYYIMQQGFVLEEYIQYIRDQGYFSFEKGGITHYVFHQVPTDGMIYVPDGRDFVVSGDNMGGYVVWAVQ